MQKLYLCDTKQIINKVFCLNHNTFSYLGEKYVLEQNGVYQTENAALAIHAAKILEKKGNASDHDTFDSKSIRRKFLVWQV